MSNFFVQELVLYRHFMLIDSPIPFELVANPTNYRKDEHGNILNTDLSEVTGRDICSRPAGAWRVDCWTLLPEKYHKQNPVFTMLIKYDKDLLEEGEIVDIRYSDIDIGEGVAGVNGQLVDIPASAFRPVVNAIESASASLADKFDEQNVFLSEINSTAGSISDDVSTIRSDVVDISNDVDSLEGKVSDIVDFFPHSFIYDISGLKNISGGFYEGFFSIFLSRPYIIFGRFCSVGEYLVSVSAKCFDVENIVYPCWFQLARGDSFPSGSLVFNGSTVNISSLDSISMFRLRSVF